MHVVILNQLIRKEEVERQRERTQYQTKYKGKGLKRKNWQTYIRSLTTTISKVTFHIFNHASEREHEHLSEENLLWGL